MTIEQLATIYEALEKVREDRRYIDALPVFYRKPFIVILKKTGDPQQAKDAVEYLRKMEVEEERSWGKAA